MDSFYIVHWQLFFFVFFFKKKSRDLSELYTAGRHHGLSLNRSPAWTSRLLSGPRRPLDCRKPHCGLPGTKGIHFGSNHTNNTGVLGLSVPQGSHKSSAIIKDWKGIKKWCIDAQTIMCFTEITSCRWSKETTVVSDIQIDAASDLTALK